VFESQRETALADRLDSLLEVVNWASFGPAAVEFEDLEMASGLIPIRIGAKQIHIIDRAAANLFQIERREPVQRLVIEGEGRWLWRVLWNGRDCGLV